MHICMLSRATIFHEYYGGMEHVLQDLAKGLVRQGQAVTILTTSLTKNQSRNIYFEKNGVSVLSIGGTVPMRYSRSWSQKSVEAFAALDQTHAVELVLSISAGAFSLLKHRDKYSHIPFVFQAHGTSMEEMRSKIRMGLKAKLSAVKTVKNYINDLKKIPRFDLVIAVGPKVYAEYVEAPRQLNENVQLIVNAIDTEFFQRSSNDCAATRRDLEISETSKVFISSSRLHPEKGIKEAIFIYDSVAKQLEDCHLLIIGDGPEKPKLQELVIRLGLEEKVHFLGTINRELLNRYYSAADFMIFLSHREEVGLPLTILEALSSSVICFTPRSIMVEEELPLIPIDIDEIEASAKSILTTIERADLKVMRQDAVKFIHKNYSYKKWIYKYMNSFQELLVLKKGDN